MIRTQNTAATNYLSLIGIKNDTYLKWKENLLLAIKDCKDTFVVEEINRVEDIVESDINVIPSLLVNGDLEMEQNSHIPSVEEFKTYLQKYI